MMSKETLKELLRFNCVGIIATATYFSIGLLLSAVASMGAMAIHLTAYAISIMVSYLGHAHFTFNVSGKKAMVRFMLSSAMLFMMSTTLTAALEHWRVHPQLIVLAAGTLYPLGSYVLHRFWTFR